MCSSRKIDSNSQEYQKAKLGPIGISYREKHI